MEIYIRESSWSNWAPVEPEKLQLPRNIKTTLWTDFSTDQRTEYLKNLGGRIQINDKWHDLKLTDVDPALQLARFKFFVNEYLQVENFEYTPEILNILNFFFDGILKLKSPKRNFVLHGPVGTGKTVLIKSLFAFTAYINVIPFPSFIPVYKLISEFRESGQEALETILRPKILIVDDLGSEDIVSDYGTKRSLLSELIYSRYDSFLSEGKRTFFTTNLTLKELKSFYGDRVFSRLIELCEYDKTALTGNDRRMTGSGLNINNFVIKQHINELFEPKTIL